MTRVLTMRAVPTAYDPPAGAVTVSTPSCCCCCCCLCATLAAATFAASEAHYQAEERQRSSVGPLILGLLAVPVVLMTLIVGAQDVGSEWGVVLAAGLVLGAATFALALLAAGVPAGRAIGIAAATTAIAAAAFAAEVVGALVTAFILELASPFAAWGAWAIARSRHRRRAPDAYAWRGSEPAYPPIPGGAPPPPGGGPAWPTAPPRSTPPRSIPPPPPPSTEDW